MVPKDSTATQAELSEALHEIPQIKSILSYADTVGETIPEQYPDSGTLSRLNREHFTRMVLTVDAAYESNETFSLVEKVRSTAEQYYPGEWYLAGEGVSTYDLMDTVTADRVNLVAQLTDEQKEQILQGAIASLTDEQKAQIRAAYIQQLMASDDMTSQINAAVAAAGDAAKQVAELKGQLDRYDAFYQGLLDYTAAVSDAAAGAKTLKLNLDTLSANTGTLRLSVGELNEAVQKLLHLFGLD